MPTSPINSDRDRVLAATDILAVIGEVVALRPKGREHVGLCPFHDDRSPSMAVVTHKAAFGGSGFYKCFACGAAGNAIDFVINYHRMEFVDALKYLASRAGIELTPYQPAADRRRDGEPTRDEILRANALAERFFRRVLVDAEAGAKARTEIARRGFSPEIVEGFGLGAAPARMDALVEGVRKAVRQGGEDYPPFEAFVQAGVIRPGRSSGPIDLLRDRLVFPIRDELGRPIAFGGRKLDPEQEPKYLNSPESPVFHKSKALYGIDRAKRAIVERKAAIVTEGYTDVIACHRAGFTNAVATLGTALTRDHARVLRRMADTVILLFDGDEAGQKAADRALEVFFSEPVDIKICVLPDGLDPDDLLRSEGGAERFADALARSGDALAFMASRIRRQLAGRGLSARQSAIEQTLAKFVDLGLNAMNGLRRQLVMQTLSELFGLPSADLDRLARSLAPRPTVDAARQTARPAPPAGSETDHGERVTDVLPSVAISGLGAAARRARIVAERRLLALLCTDPAAARVPVAVEDSGALPLSEVLAPSAFADESHSAIFAVIAAAAEEARVLSFEALLGALDDQRLKRLASDLRLLGDELLVASATQSGSASEGSALLEEELRSSWLDLENLERRQRFRAEALREGAAATSAGSDSLNTVTPNPVPTASSGSSASSVGATSVASREPSPGFDAASADESSCTGRASTHGSMQEHAPAAGSGAGRKLDPEAAAERLKRLRERGHDATAARALFRRGPGAAAEPGRSNNP